MEILIYDIRIIVVKLIILVSQQISHIENTYTINVYIVKYNVL